MNPISSLSFYDSLNKLVVGILVVHLLIPSPSKVWDNPIFYIVAFVVGIFYQSLVRQSTLCLTNNLCMIRKAYKVFCVKHPEEIVLLKNEDDYLTAYYTVAKNGLLMNIPTLEALENFMRNMFFILIFYLVALLAQCPNVVSILKFLGCGCGIAIALALSILFTIKIWYCTQLKIHELVWEGSYYIKKIEKIEQEENEEDTNFDIAGDNNS